MIGTQVDSKLFLGHGLPLRGIMMTLVRHATLCGIPLDMRSDRRRDLYLRTHNTHNRQTSMPPAGIEPAISASERPQTHASERAATAIGR
jgi:hypothetical protein